MSTYLRVAPEVADAVRAGAPAVALESTLFVHGLPAPDGLRLADELETSLRGSGVVPAMVGVVGGQPVVGLSGEEVGLLTGGGDVPKASVRDLPLAAARRSHGATTVASTAWLAHRAGIRVFATGGLGGVHRGASATFDESADLVALARTPITVVCAGAKSVLDVPATLERLETLGVVVAGWRSARFPGFLVADSGYRVRWAVDGPEQVVDAVHARDRLGLTSAVVVAARVPEAEQMDPAQHDRLLADALDAAGRDHVAGGDVTPYLLDHLQQASAGAALAANVAAVRNNVRIAAEIAVALSRASRT